MTVIAFAEGDRVRIKADRVDNYIQPWRGRFQKGRVGTIQKIRELDWGRMRARVLWDHNKRAHDYDFTMSVDIRDLELSE